MTHRVYLSGPVTDKSIPDLSAWRDQVATQLGTSWAVYDPTKGPVVTQRLSGVTGATRRPEFKGFAHDMVARNRVALSNCDLVIANLIGAKEVSIGTVGELFWADAFHRPIILLRETSGNRHDHLMINEIATWIVQTVPEAIDLARTSIEKPSQSAKL
jgi:hypothetical protein